LSDKFRVLFPIAATFSEGELPADLKLTGIARQAKSGLSLVEFALGDPWNQAGDQMLISPGLTTYANMIPNISRYLGATRLTNPMVPALSAIDDYTYSFLLDDSGAFEATLTFPPAAGLSGTDYTWAGTSPPTNSQLKANKSDVDATGDWYINTDTGYCYFYDPVNTDWTVAYEPLVDGDAETQEFNVIPDPAQESGYNFKSCKIAYTNNVDNSQGYIIYLPPRGPLASARQLNRFPQSSFDATGNSANESGTPDAGDKLFWQDDGFDASTASTYAEHYRYNLPAIMTDNWSQDAQLPTGLLYLWDWSQTGTIIEGVLLKAENATVPRTWLLVAAGSAMDDWVSNYLTAAGYPADALTQRDNHAQTYYPSSGLRLITVGKSITTYLETIQKRLMNHDHSSSSSMPTQPVEHGELNGLFQPTDGTNIQLDPSKWIDDGHVGYLHRWGSHPLISERDRFKGGMLGSLFFNSTGSSNDYQNLTSDSNQLVFGDLSAGPYLRYSVADDALAVAGKPFLADANLVYGGVFGPKPVSDGTYGYSAPTAAAGYGALRAYVIPPEDFLSFYATGGGGSYFTSGLAENRAHIQYYDASASDIQGLQLILHRQGAAVAYLFAHINLPFQKYAIVNVEMSVSPITTNLSASNTFTAALGTSLAGATGALGGEVETSVDLHDVDSGGPNDWDGTTAGTYTTTLPIFSVLTTSAHVEVDLTGSLSSWDFPWFRLSAAAGSVSDDLEVRNVVVYYRVKEF
jgi:hypothetical protein